VAVTDSVFLMRVLDRLQLSTFKIFVIIGFRVLPMLSLICSPICYWLEMSVFFIEQSSTSFSSDELEFMIHDLCTS
jgi:hypothetical protein